jgi:hypothetical protein
MVPRRTSQPREAARRSNPLPNCAHTVTTARPADSPKLSVPSPNRKMKPETTPVGLHRIPDATLLLWHHADGRSGPVLALTMEPRLVPTLRYERFGESAAVLNVPLGLVASPETRTVATLIAVEALRERLGWSGATAQISAEPRARLPEQLEWQARPGSTLEETKPLVAAVGQAAVNRVIGLEDAVAQERAYGPKPADWADQGPGQAVKFLTALEVGGQALVPCLVWDALRIPCSISAPIFDDEFGQFIIDRLGTSEWIDFSIVTTFQKTRRQLADEPLDLSIPATENATIVTWNGLRTILDSLRRFDKGGEGVNVDGAAIADAPIVYMTKPGWRSVERVLKTENVETLLIHETGGRSDPEIERSVAARKGIIISSALSAVCWLGSGSSDMDRQNEWLAKVKPPEPRDDRGRLWQMRKLLEEVERCDGFPPSLRPDGELHDLRAYVVTAGELGASSGPKKGLSGVPLSGQPSPSDSPTGRYAMVSAAATSPGPGS